MTLEVKNGDDASSGASAIATEVESVKAAVASPRRAGGDGFPLPLQGSKTKKCSIGQAAPKRSIPIHQVREQYNDPTGPHITQSPERRNHDALSDEEAEA